MATTIQDLAARIGEDIYLPYVAADTVDLSDWDDWELESYVYDKNGTLVAACKESESTIVRTAPGQFYSWLKKEFTLTFSRDKYTWQTRRVDDDHNFVLHDGTLKMLAFAPPTA